MQRMESDRSLNTELALKDVYNKKRLYSAIGFEKEKERKVLILFLNYIPRCTLYR